MGEEGYHYCPHLGEAGGIHSDLIVFIEHVIGTDSIYNYWELVSLKNIYGIEQKLNPVPFSLCEFSMIGTAYFSFSKIIEKNVIKNAKIIAKNHYLEIPCKDKDFKYSFQKRPFYSNILGQFSQALKNIFGANKLDFRKSYKADDD